MRPRKGSNARLSRKRGFTLVEMMVSIAIMAISGAIAIPHFERLGRRSRLDFIARELIANLQLARNTAITGAPIDKANPAAGRIRYAGVRFGVPSGYSGSCDVQLDPSPPRYYLYGDTDSDLCGGVLLGKVELDIAARHPEDLQIAIESSTFYFAFRSDGTTNGSHSVAVIDRDLKEQRTITINRVGYVTLTKTAEFDPPPDPHL